MRQNHCRPLLRGPEGTRLWVMVVKIDINTQFVKLRELCVQYVKPISQRMITTAGELL